MSDLLVDPTNASRLWATYSDVSGAHAFRSDDGGTTWEDRSAGLPPIPANAVEVDPQDGNRVWIAADVGVWQSLDGGATWAAFGSGLPNALAADLLLHPTRACCESGRAIAAPGRSRSTAGSTAGGRRAVDRHCAGERHPDVVHGQLAGELARPVDGDPDDRAPGAPQVHWTVQVERT